MKRALTAIGSVLALVVLPGAVLAVGLVAAYRYCFRRENRVSEDWLLEMAKAEGREEFVRDMDGARVIVAPRPSVNGGPPAPVSRYTDEVPR